VHDGVVGAARRALELDSALAQPHVALGLLYQFDNQWDRASTEFQTAVRLDGRNVEARVQYARHLLIRGRHVEALSQLRAAREEDPASALVLSWMSYGYFLEGQMDSALVESRRALQDDSANLTSVSLGAQVRLGNGLPHEARALIDRAPADPAKLYVIAKSGAPTMARQRLQELDATTPQPWLAETKRGYAYLGLGDTAKALSALERATDGKEIWPSFHGVTDPIYASIRGSARFQALLRRVGLAP
jgi:tetratricopeptide (TPR) repeat protein